MRIYLKYFLVIFILVWTLGVFYMLVSNDEANARSRSGAAQQGRVVQEGNLDEDIGFVDSSAKSIETYKREFRELKAQYDEEIKKARHEISSLKKLNEQNQQEIGKLR